MAKGKQKVASDKRRASWVLTTEAREDIRECFRSDAAILSETKINAKTGGKILNLTAVKKDKLKDFIKEYLEFLEEFESGDRSHDSARHHERDIRTMIKKYIVNGSAVDWRSLARELPDEE